MVRQFHMSELSENPKEVGIEQRNQSR